MLGTLWPVADVVRPHPSLAAEFPLSNLSLAVRITRVSLGRRGP